MFVPAVDAQEAALVEGVTIIPVATLSALIGHLRGDLSWLGERSLLVQWYALVGQGPSPWEVTADGASR